MLTLSTSGFSGAMCNIFPPFGITKGLVHHSRKFLQLPLAGRSYAQKGCSSYKSGQSSGNYERSESKREAGKQTCRAMRCVLLEVLAHDLHYWKFKWQERVGTENCEGGTE